MRAEIRGDGYRQKGSPMEILESVRYPRDCGPSAPAENEKSSEYDNRIYPPPSPLRSIRATAPKTRKPTLRDGKSLLIFPPGRSRTSIGATGFRPFARAFREPRYRAARNGSWRGNRGNFASELANLGGRRLGRGRRESDASRRARGLLASKTNSYPRPPVSDVFLADNLLLGA
ncbi:hypothetical protein KM043_007348 [Ampulex compressa]|nr:hypothetical protein KM043_007348 [Ampulex compressa]